MSSLRKTMSLTGKLLRLLDKGSNQFTRKTEKKFGYAEYGNVGSITLDHVYDSLLKTAQHVKETTVKLCGKSSDLIVVIKSSSNDDES